MLYVVPTPIGNLEDMTHRAIRILKEVDLILAEDTRVSGRLMAHYGIETNLVSYHAHNEHKNTASWVEKMKTGVTLALISDAGTPGISDPGFLLVREAIKEGIVVDCLPGPTALIPALVLSGLPCDQFVFIGFLPHKKGRQTKFKELAEESRTVVLYESPHRIVKTLNQLGEFCGLHRQISVSRELSKKFEENFRGTVEEAIAHFESKKPKGEFVVVLGGK